jgi:hypothetical protein
VTIAFERLTELMRVIYHRWLLRSASFLDGREQSRFGTPAAKLAGGW